MTLSKFKNLLTR